ncbi:hypothetical protein C2U54_20910 [Leclercia sp. LSNIH1]|nr:hypothetical protein C2U54_20910 [Leclercia sp. LSNIH1]POV36620.1 hypothetical protein C3388_04930 [Leclercia sp. LSNIH5]POW68436.1 hypothetical protein C3389_01515 [Leclercia sp. LSNIH2]
MTCRTISLPAGRAPDGKAVLPECISPQRALFQGNSATAIISSTFNSFFPFQALRFVWQTCYLSPLR